MRWWIGGSPEGADPDCAGAEVRWRIGLLDCFVSEVVAAPGISFRSGSSLRCSTSLPSAHRSIEAGGIGIESRKQNLENRWNHPYPRRRCGDSLRRIHLYHPEKGPGHGANSGGSSSASFRASAPHPGSGCHCGRWCVDLFRSATSIVERESVYLGANWGELTSTLKKINYAFRRIRGANFHQM